MVRLQERAPQIPTFLVDVKVQGEGAAKDIAEALKFLDASGLCEVIILARGGGSLEDLWSFNEEIVVRSIFACRTPVISGVGHEVDVTLADFVADMRAPTPTAAAEMVAPRTKDLLKELDQFSRRLTDTDRWLTPLGQRVDDLELRLTHVTKTRLDALALQVEAVAGKVAAIQPREILAHLQSKLRLLEERLLGRQRKAYDTWQNMLRLCESRLENSSFRRELPRLSEKLETSYQRLERAIRTNQMRTVQIVETLAQRLEAVNPKSVLTRGYAIVEGVKGVLSSSQNIEQDDSISITFKDGKVKASVTGKESL
jgi:exodeoxyribonuclease VII large subunit